MHLTLHHLSIKLSSWSTLSLKGRRQWVTAVWPHSILHISYQNIHRGFNVSYWTWSHVPRCLISSGYSICWLNGLLIFIYSNHLFPLIIVPHLCQENYILIKTMNISTYTKNFNFRCQWPKQMHFQKYPFNILDFTYIWNWGRFSEGNARAKSKNLQADR